MKTAPKLAGIMLAVFAGLSYTGTAQTSQYVTLASSAVIGSATLSVQTNQIVSLVGYDWVNTPYIFGNLSNGQTAYMTPWNYPFQNVKASLAQIPQIFTGLTSITVATNPNPGAVTFQIITPASANVVSNYVPADAIVIPASATGNVQIILESSPDLVNWTAASPGTYGASSATNRFFRVRAVLN